MKTQAKPQMSILKTGKEYKLLKVTGGKGSQMPNHYSTKEAIIILLKGEALLCMGGKEILLMPSELTLFPASEPHKLFIKEDLEANVIMALDSEKKFLTN